MSIKENDDGYTFKEWERLANAACISWCGVDLDSATGDPNSYDAWQDGEDPMQFAEDRLRAEGFPFE